MLPSISLGCWLSHSNWGKSLRGPHGPETTEMRSALLSELWWDSFPWGRLAKFKWSLPFRTGKWLLRLISSSIGSGAAGRGENRFYCQTFQDQKLSRFLMLQWTHQACFLACSPLAAGIPTSEPLSTLLFRYEWTTLNSNHALCFLPLKPSPKNHLSLQFITSMFESKSLSPSFLHVFVLTALLRSTLITQGLSSYWCP